MRIRIIGMLFLLDWRSESSRTRRAARWPHDQRLMTSTVSPSATVEPSDTRIDWVTPAKGAAMGNSMFMETRTARLSPSETRTPHGGIDFQHYTGEFRPDVVHTQPSTVRYSFGKPGDPRALQKQEPSPFLGGSLSKPNPPVTHWQISRVSLGGGRGAYQPVESVALRSWLVRRPWFLSLTKLAGSGGHSTSDRADRPASRDGPSPMPVRPLIAWFSSSGGTAASSRRLFPPLSSAHSSP
jgi:hypothetical protein